MIACLCLGYSLRNCSSFFFFCRRRYMHRPATDIYVYLINNFLINVKQCISLRTRVYEYIIVKIKQTYTSLYIIAQASRNKNYNIAHMYTTQAIYMQHIYIQHIYIYVVYMSYIYYIYYIYIIYIQGIVQFIYI